MKKILIIEDELAYVRLLRDKLAPTYEVLDAQDGKRGLDMAIKQKPDIILLDIRMPKLDGMTMLSELRKDPHGKTVKVIILTNLEVNEQIVEQVTKNLPAHYFVKSDVALNDLLDKIDELARESK